jgi:hypothetical protein
MHLHATHLFAYLQNTIEQGLTPAIATIIRMSKALSRAKLAPRC